MAWRERDTQKRRMLVIDNKLELVIEYLFEFYNLYKNDHPDLANASQVISQSVVIIQEAVVKLRESF